VGDRVTPVPGQGEGGTIDPAVAGVDRAKSGGFQCERMTMAVRSPRLMRSPRRKARKPGRETGVEIFAKERSGGQKPVISVVLPPSRGLSTNF